ncbi:MAG TPA: hypothetical protein VEK82_00900 [Stellaceae bacterium]|nr:hypothetical protein [Stellaceae bacterium]
MSERRQGITARRWVALVGIAAILFQALLFGWHHHAIAVPGGAVASFQNAARAPAPATAEHLCEICAVLHQQGAAPLAFFTPPMPAARGSAIDLPARVVRHRAVTRGFEARAPPAVESTT